MAATRLIAMHHNKGKTLAQCLKERTDYAQNPEKTEKGNLVTAYECDPMTCDEEFLLSKRQYEHITGKKQKNDVIAYQIRQSFKPGEITPEEANAVGYELAMRFTKGKHAFIVATHTDRAHIHNHIIYNSTSLDFTRKFRDFHLSGLAVQRLSDIICLEHGLSVIEKRPYREHVKREKYPREQSFRDEIRDAIDAAMKRKPKSFDELIFLLQDAGYEYKTGKQPGLRGKGQQRFIRLRSLGEGYSVDELTAKIEGTRVKLSFLIDIQAKIQQGKGGGYTQWAKVFNLKQMAQTMLFLEGHEISSFEDLETQAAAMSSKCDSLLASVRADEQRMQEIAALRKHIINYSKARDTFAEYKKSGYSQKYFEAHRETLTLRRAAKEAFDDYKKKYGADMPLPKIKELNAEYSSTLERKKRNYAEYRKIRSEMQEWQIAQRIVQTILHEDGSEQERTAEQRQTQDGR